MPPRHPRRPAPGRSGLLVVVQVRLEALQRAIQARNWQDTEWEFDRVRSAVDKATAGGAPRGPDGTRT